MAENAVYSLVISYKLNIFGFKADKTFKGLNMVRSFLQIQLI